ncbi:MAG TPA: c-type cytochrome biogenesis protein CcsB [Streptosporangiaceae bacterium]|nr:c-type cytochrome biogenesis protein CcsB [Streptosporangiaceae bacterium]
MPINEGLAHLSDHFLLATIAAYSLGVLGFAGDFAYGRRTQPAAEPEATRELVPAAAKAAPVSASQAGTLTATPGVGGGPAPVSAEPRPPGDGGQAAPAASGRLPAGPWVRAALILTTLGLAAHITGVVTRGLAVDRVPWGDMYEFVIAVTCVAVAFFLGLMFRYRPYYLGLFVMAPIVVIMGLAETVIYTPAGPLVPALHSYWLAIHVTAMTLATGTFFVAAVCAVVFLLADRYRKRAAAGLPARGAGIFSALPKPEIIDRFAYRTVVFAFPIWTFGIMAGAIWADEAWGRYWGWDPTETWAFITWVVYACFLHARVTAGWRGRRAALIQLVGFACLLFNLLGVSLFITGLHSYAGLS